MAVSSNIIWISKKDDKIIDFLKTFESSRFYKCYYFHSNEEAISKIKTFRFEETFIIVNGNLYIQFIEQFQNNLKDLYIVPKIIIFTDNKEDFINRNNEYKKIINHPFYNSGGIKSNFDEINNFISNPICERKILSNNYDDKHLVFEYIESKEQLLLPMFYKTLLEVISNDKINSFNQFLFNKYHNKSDSLDILLNSIKSVSEIPIELLSKYYTRIYTEQNSYFYGDLNKDLRENKRNDYLSFIKVLYEGVKIQSLPISSDKILYRGSLLSKVEIEKIKSYLNNKKEGLPGAIVFSKAFLSFTKEKNIAHYFLNANKNINIELFSKVLFILEKDENIDYSLSTHADIEELSYFNEKEILFFPFSSFEIKEINEINGNYEKIYEIRLLYLGKYTKEFSKSKDFEKEKYIPNTEFKKQIVQFGLIRPEIINENTNTRKIIRIYEEYKDNIVRNRNKNQNIKQIVRSIEEKEKDRNLNNNEKRDIKQSVNNIEENEKNRKLNNNKKKDIRQSINIFEQKEKNTNIKNNEKKDIRQSISIFELKEKKRNLNNNEAKDIRLTVNIFEKKDRSENLNKNMRQSINNIEEKEKNRNLKYNEKKDIRQSINIFEQKEKIRNLNNNDKKDIRQSINIFEQKERRKLKLNENEENQKFRNTLQNKNEMIRNTKTDKEKDIKQLIRNIEEKEKNISNDNKNKDIRNTEKNNSDSSNACKEKDIKQLIRNIEEKEKNISNDNKNKDIKNTEKNNLDPSNTFKEKDIKKLIKNLEENEGRKNEDINESRLNQLIQIKKLDKIKIDENEIKNTNKIRKTIKEKEITIDLDDNLDLENSEFVSDLIGKEIIYFSDFISKIPIAKLFNQAQERIFLITNVSIYILKGNKLKRRIKIEDITGITISLINDQFIIHGNAAEYDLLFSSPKRKEIITILEYLSKIISDKDLLFCEKNEEDLSKFAVSRKERKKNPLLNKINSNELISIFIYINSKN